MDLCGISKGSGDGNGTFRAETNDEGKAREELEQGASQEWRALFLC